MPESITPTPEILSKYSVVNGKLLMTAKSDWRDKLEVEIGDTKLVDFYPQVKIQRWDNEVNCSIRLKDTELGLATITFDKDNIIWKKGNIESHFYDIVEGEGGYECDIHLKADPRPTKTGNHKIEFTLNAKGLSFLLQLPLTSEYQNGYCEEFKREIEVSETQVWGKLTQEELDKMPDKPANGMVLLVERPERVVNSLAVYCSEKKINWKNGKLYKNSKFGHLFYPYMIDANGWKVRAEDFKLELNPEKTEGLLTITISEDFLNKAVYPIRHAAGLEFGYHTVGQSSDNFTANYIQRTTDGFTGAAGTGLSMSLYCYRATAGNIQMAIYNNTTLVDNTVSVSGSALNWYSANLGGETLSAISYYLCFNSAVAITAYYDGVAGDMWRCSQTFGTWPSPITWSSPGPYSNRTYSLFVVYEESGITTYTKTKTARARIKQLGTSKTLQSRGRIKTVALTKLVTMRAKIQLLATNRFIQVRGKIKNTSVKILTSKSRTKIADITKKLTSRGRIETSDLAKQITARTRMKTSGVSKKVQSRARLKTVAVTKLLTERGRVKIPDLTKNITSQARVKTANLSKNVQSRGRVKIVDIVVPVLISRARISGLTGDKYLQIRARLQQLDLSKLLQIMGRVETSDLSAKITARGKIKATQEKKTTFRARVKQVGLLGILQSRGRISTLKSKLLTIRARISLLNGGDRFLSLRAKVVDVGKTYLYLPASGTSENIPVSFEWYIPSNRWGKNLNFQLQIDKTDDNFGDLELEKRSYQDSGFEYWDGDSWETLPTSGVENSYAGNLARFITNLTNGLKYWRVRAFAG